MKADTAHVVSSNLKENSLFEQIYITLQTSAIFIATNNNYIADIARQIS